MLVPVSPDAPTQVVDVRDLASWLLDAAQAGTTGTYDAVGPCLPLSCWIELSRGVGRHQGPVVAATADWLSRAGLGHVHGSGLVGDVADRAGLEAGPAGLEPQRSRRVCITADGRTCWSTCSPGNAGRALTDHARPASPRGEKPSSAASRCVAPGGVQLATSAESAERSLSLTRGAVTGGTGRAPGSTAIGGVPWPALGPGLAHDADPRGCVDVPFTSSVRGRSRPRDASRPAPTRPRSQPGDKPRGTVVYFPRRRSTASTAVQPSGMSESICATPSRSAPSVTIGTSL